MHGKNVMSEKNSWKTVSTKVVYENPWIRVDHNDVILPNGKPGIYGVVNIKNNAVGIVPLDKDYNTWLVGQHRYTIDKYTWEIPEGGSFFNEDPVEGGKRELREEVGILAKKWTSIVDTQLSNSVTTQRAFCYIAQDLDFTDLDPDDTEELQIKKLPFKKVFQMVMNNEVCDDLSVMAILKTKILIDQGKI